MAQVADARTTALRVRGELRQAILDGTLAPGERLRAEAVAERFDASRTPVREALILLEREGLVDLEPHRGAVVRLFDAADLVDVYEVRALLESHAAGRAAARISESVLDRLAELCALGEVRDGRTPEAVAEQIELNDEFHRLILEAAASPRLTAAMRGVAGIPRAFRSAFWASDEQRTRSLFCHRELLAALRAGRPELAEAVMLMHVLSAREFLATVILGQAE